MSSHKSINEISPSVTTNDPVVEGDSRESTVLHSTFCHDPDSTWKEHFTQLSSNFHFSPTGLYNKGGIYHLNSYL